MANYSQKQKAEILHNLTNKLKGKAEQKNVIDWQIAELLYEINSKKYFRYHDIAERPGFGVWLANSEVPISHSKANYWIRLYEFWVVENKYKTQDLIDISAPKLDKLRKAFPVSIDLKGAQKLINKDWLEKALVLSESDLQKEIDEVLGKEVCGHIGWTVKEKKEITKCNHCGKVLKDG